MDESALRILLAKLEGSQSSFHWWLEFWTAMVALGVILEVVFVVWEYIEDLHDFRRGIVHPPERPSTVLLLLGLFGASLVAVGVSGEWYEEASVEHVETQIRQANDALYLLLSKEAGDAAKSAKIAHDEADAVKGIADEARADAKDALAKAQSAQRELANAEADSAKAQGAASRALSTADKAESHLAEAVKRANELTEQLKRLTTPRTLTSVPELIASLKPYAGTQYQWAGLCADAECISLLVNIDGVLEQAGWKRMPSVSTYPALIVFADEPTGIAETLIPGIRITVEAPNGSELVAKHDVAQAPRQVQAAWVLDLALAANVYPPENQDRTPSVMKIGDGPSTVVRLTIGRKVVP